MAHSVYGLGALSSAFALSGWAEIEEARHPPILRPTPFLLFFTSFLCPVSVRARSAQPCSLFDTGELGVLRPARQSPDWLRGRVLPTSPRLKDLRPAAAPTAPAHGTIDTAQSLSSALVALSRSSCVSSRASHRRFAAAGVVACVSAPLCRVAPGQPCASPRLTRTVVADLAQFAPCALATSFRSRRMEQRTPLPPRR